MSNSNEGGGKPPRIPSEELQADLDRLYSLEQVIEVMKLDEDSLEERIKEAEKDPAQKVLVDDLQDELDAKRKKRTETEEVCERLRRAVNASKN